MLMHIQLHDMAAHDMTLHGNTYDIHYIHDIHYIRDIHYIHYRQYIQYIQDIHDIHYRHIAFPEVSIHDTTQHDMTLLHILTYGSCAHGKGKGTEKKNSRVVQDHAARGHYHLKLMLSHLHAGLRVLPALLPA